MNISQVTDQQTSISLEIENENQQIHANVKPSLDPVAALDYEMSYQMLIWQQMKREMSSDKDHRRKMISEKILQFKSALVKNISEISSALKRPLGLQIHQTQFKAEISKKQIRLDNYKSSKPGRKRKTNVMQMPETPEKRKIEDNLLDANYKSPKSVSKSKSKAKTNTQKSKVVSKPKAKTQKAASSQKSKARKTLFKK